MKTFNPTCQSSRDPSIFSKNRNAKSFEIRRHTVEVLGTFRSGKNNLFNHELLKEISRKYNKSIAQVVLRWLVQREVVAIPKSANMKRISENFNVFDFELSGDDMEAIKSLDKGRGIIYSV